MLHRMETYLILKETQPRMWDDGKYSLVVPGRPTRARRVSVGCPGTTSEYIIQKGPFLAWWIYCIKALGLTPTWSQALGPNY